jgi:hypothetical protein
MIEWLSNRVEERWGKLAAWFVTLALVGGFAAAAIWLITRWL